MMIKPLTFWSLIISSAFLFYCAAFSRMTIWHDSIGYQELATFLSDGQWAQYFIQGPNREPFYPALVALAMPLGKSLAIPYQSIVMIIQVFVLLLTEMLMVLIMSRLGIRDLWQAIVILYTTFSPSILNFTFILWSDFTPAPLILGGILVYSTCWKHLLHNASLKVILKWGIGLAIILCGLTLLKAAFELISILIILSFLFYIPVWLNKNLHLKLIVFILILISSYQTCIQSYKWLNWHYNGHYVLTDRGSWALYGSIARRMQPMTLDKWTAAVLVIPHNDFCKTFINPARCDYWGSDVLSNQLGFTKKGELNQHLNPAQSEKALVNLAIQSILGNPFQALTLGIIEGSKLLFWEYFTPTAYVVYPFWIHLVYDWRPLMLFLRILLSVLTILALLWGIFMVWRNIRRGEINTPLPADQLILLISMLIWIIAYIIPYSFFFLFGRYAIALAPIYLILIARMFNKSPMINAQDHHIRP